MPVVIDFGKGKEEAQEVTGNEAEKSKMQECITMIEAGEGEKAIPILKALIAGEDAETEEAPVKKSFREEMADKI